MKKLSFILILLITIVSCGRRDVSYSARNRQITILNKEKTPCARGGGYCYYRIFLYDGVVTYWCDVNEETYNSYNKNDTITTLIITKTVNKKIKI